jgi:isoleucyl-tRNA synthetase
MHKSWGNAIEFDEAAERMGVDTMRWLFAKARPEDNINFGWHAADEARRELLILWNVYAFFVTYARLAGWTPQRGIDEEVAAAESWPVLDRWILSRSAGLAAEVGHRLDDYDAVGATRAQSAFIDDLSTWYLRRSRDRMRQGADPADQGAAFATLHAALVSLTRSLAPVLPFLSEGMYQNLIVSVVPSLPDSVHLTAWPAETMAPFRDEDLERAMTTVRQAVELARTLRGQAGLRTRQPLATAWIAVPDRGVGLDDDLLALFADELNVKAVEVIADGSALVDRRVKPLLPRIGKRLGPAIPAVMAAARSGEFEILTDGSVRLGGETLAPDEVEIQATPRPGTAVAEHDGIVVVLDTELTPELRAEGDARELQRAVQDLRRDAGLELDDRIDLWIAGVDGAISQHLPSIAEETLGVLVEGEPPADATAGEVRLEGGVARVGVRRRAGGQDR